MLSATELAAAQAAAAAALPDTATVERPTMASDGAGGQTVAWQAAGSYAARLAPAGAEDERQMAGRMTATCLWRITLPAGADVRPGDRLQVSGRRFEVLAARARSFEVCRVVLATLLE